MRGHLCWLLLGLSRASGFTASQHAIDKGIAESDPPPPADDEGSAIAESLDTDKDGTVGEKDLVVLDANKDGNVTPEEVSAALGLTLGRSKRVLFGWNFLKDTILFPLLPPRRTTSAKPIHKQHPALQTG